VTGIHRASSLAAGIALSLLTFQAQAEPRALAQAGSAPTTTAPPPLSPQGPERPAPGQPGPQPYSPPPQPGPYPLPAPGVYSQPAPAYPYPAYAYPPPGGYPPPYYAAPLDMRPLVLEYDPDKPIPPGYHLESRARKGFVISGSIIFGISYGIALMVASSTNQSTSSSSSSSSSSGVPFQSSLLYIPVLGPWLAMGTVRDSDCTSSNYYYCDNSEASDWRTLLAIGGVTQALGAGFIVLGLAARTHQLVLTEYVQASVLPVRMGRSGQGLAMVGSFSGL